MKKYDKGATCYKCGYGGIEDMHRDKESQAFCNLSNNLARAGGSLANPRDPRPEHINRICRNCGHSWDERPLDSVDHSVSEAIREAIDRSNPFKPAREAAKSGSLEDRFKDVKYKRCWPTKEETQKWMDALADIIAPAVGLPAEMLKRPFPPNDPGGVKATCEMAKTDKPVIKVSDVVTSTCDKFGYLSQCEVLKIGNTLARLGKCDGICSCSNLEIASFHLIRKGPKVRTLKGMKGTDVAIYVSGVQVNCMGINSDKTYTITATEEDAK